MGARRRCCCDCYFVFDPFPVDGADVNDVNANWEECEGDWEITSSMLTTEDANAVCTFVPMVGWPVGIFTARVAISKIEPAINSIGGTAQIFAYVGSSGSPCSGTGLPWKAELEITSGTEGTLRLYDPAGDLAGERLCIFTVGWTEFWMCVGWNEAVGTGEVLTGCDDQMGTPIWACYEDTMPDYYFALGNKLASPNQVYYEETFYIDQYDHNTLCPDCSVPCCCPCIEDELNRPTLTITVVKGDDPDCDISGGETATMECVAISGDCCTWTTPDATPLVLVCELADQIELKVRMECGGEAGYGIMGRCEDYYMTIGLKNPAEPEDMYCFTAATGGTGDIVKGVVGECTCEPALYVKFGPFYLWRNPSMLPYDGHQCHCCQEFYIEVTE